jgi:hypothetical protein
MIHLNDQVCDLVGLRTIVPVDRQADRSPIRELPFQMEADILKICLDVLVARSPSFHRGSP